MPGGERVSNQLAAINKLLKIFYIVWLINLPYFTGSLWFYFYFKHIGHWAEGPFQGMMSSGIIVKTVFSVAILITLINRWSIEDKEAKDD